MKKSLVILLVCLALWPGKTRACGGPSYFPVAEVLAPVDDMLQQLLSPVDSYGDGSVIEAFLFLYPFHVDPSRREQIEGLWKFSYENRYGEENAESKPSDSKLSEEAYESAVKRGDLDAAETAAKSLVDRILDLPLALANEYQATLARSVEFLELKPFLPTTPISVLQSYFVFSPGSQSLWPKAPNRPWAMLSLPLALQQGWIVRLSDSAGAASLAERFPQSPRAGTLRFLALQQRFRREIPNGWTEDIRKNTPAQTWQSLQKDAEAWLTRFAAHPLADLVRLTQLRGYYYQGKRSESWDLLLSIYPRRLPRVLGEMRFLLKQGLNPERNAKAAEDPVLKTSLLPFFPQTLESWTQDWKSAEAALPAAWAVNLQERLLSQAISQLKKGSALPSGFPDRPANPSQLWGQLRLMALLKAGQLDAALVQAQSLASGTESDLLKARVFLARHEWLAALAVPKLPEDAKRYLLRVLFDDETLRRICSGDGMWRDEACLVIAAHAAARGDWEEGAKSLSPGQAKRAELFRRAATLAADGSNSGLLAYARFLKTQHGKIFFSPSTDWYRSLNYRLSSLKDIAAESAPTQSASPWTAEQESRAIRDYFTDSSELFYALKAYAAWLKKADPKDPQAAKVLQEADKTYNSLINWDNWNSPFWQEFLQDSEWAVAIREAGKKIR